MLDLLMAPEAIDLLLGYVLIMDEGGIVVLFCAVNVAEVTLVFRRYAVTLCYFEVAVTALPACLQSVVMRECLASHYDSLFWSRVAGPASGENLVMSNAFEMTEIADIERHLHVITLNDVRMAAPAVELNSTLHLAEMQLVVKGDPPFRDDTL